MTTYDKLYIDGAWVPSTGTDTLDVIESTTEQVFATIPAGTTDDIDRAVVAAKAAFPTWSEESAPERGKLLRRVAEELEARRDEIADVITHEVGMPKGQSAAIQVGMGIAAFQTASELASTFPFEDRSDGLVVREPIGVVGCITPWNYPLNQIGAKVAYALAAGCTVVLKPSEVAPVNAFILAEIMDEIGFPPGVFNLVTGLGPVVGEALAAHPDVDMVSFTGSTRGGQARVGARIAVDQAGRARARREVAERAPRRRGLPGCGQARRRRCVRELGTDLQRADSDDRPEVAALRSRGPRPRRCRGLHGRRSVRRGHPPRAVDLRGATGTSAGLHREGDRRRRGARHRRRGGAGLARDRILREADRLLERHPRHDDRAGGDLRPCAVDHPLRHRGRGRRHRERLVVRARRRCLRQRRTRRSASPASCAPAR